MTPGGEDQGGLRRRIAGQAEDAIGRIADDLLENPMINSALSRAFTAREKVAQAQQSAMDALNLPSASELEKLGRRLRTISQRLEEVEDAVDKIGVRLEGLSEEARVGREPLRPARPDGGAPGAAGPRRRRPAPGHRPRGRARRATRDRPGGVVPSRGSGKGAPRAVPDAVRRAVERTVQSTLGSAEVTRERAQELVDDVVRMAEHSAARAGRGVRGAGQRPAVAADRVRDALQDLRTATERLAERVAQLETQLEEQLGVTPKRGSAKSKATKPKRTATRSAPPRKRSATKTQARKASSARGKGSTAKRRTAAASKPKRASGATTKRATASKPKRAPAKPRASRASGSSAGRRTSGSKRRSGTARSG